jgi:hypothetical protein
MCHVDGTVGILWKLQNSVQGFKLKPTRLVVAYQPRMDALSMHKAHQ